MPPSMRALDRWPTKNATFQDRETYSLTKFGRQNGPREVAGAREWEGYGVATIKRLL